MFVRRNTALSNRLRSNVRTHEAVTLGIANLRFRGEGFEITRVSEQVDIDDPAIRTLTKNEPDEMAADKTASSGNQNRFHLESLRVRCMSLW
jgi:hypothetical protein